MSCEEREVYPVDPAELEQLSLFEGVDLGGFSDILLGSEARELQPGDMLLEKEKVNGRMYILLEGRLSIHLQADSDAIAVLERGDTAGDMSVITGQATSAYVKADTHCRLMGLDGQLLWGMFERSSQLARNMLHMYAKRLVHLNTVITSAQQLQQEYRHHATTDPLTGLYNRRWLNESLAFEISRCQLRQRPLTVLVVDIDHFKLYNDTHGHVAGDQALKATAHAVLVALRGSDMAVRYGGEEIVIVLPGADVAEGEKVAQRLHRAVMDEDIRAHDGAELPKVTISIGVAQMVSGDSAEQLIARADAALYRAKAAGRNCTSR